MKDEVDKERKIVCRIRCNGMLRIANIIKMVNRLFKIIIGAERERERERE